MQSDHISGFDIYLKEKQNSPQNLSELLQSMLMNRIPSHAPQSLLTLCLEYSDIFALPGDKSSINNLYKQKLNLTDNVPVFVKNYRLPETQKAEINRQA